MAESFRQSHKKIKSVYKKVKKKLGWQHCMLEESGVIAFGTQGKQT